MIGSGPPVTKTPSSMLIEKVCSVRIATETNKHRKHGPVQVIADTFVRSFRHDRADMVHLTVGSYTSSTPSEFGTNRARCTVRRRVQGRLLQLSSTPTRLRVLAAAAAINASASIRPDSDLCCSLDSSTAHGGPQPPHACRGFPYRLNSYRTSLSPVSAAARCHHQ